MESFLLLCSQTSLNSNTSGDDSIISSLLWNIVASLIFAGLVWLFQQCRYFFILKRPIHNKKYKVFYKRFGTEVKMEVVCRTKQNRIVFDGNVLNGDSNPKIHGELIVNLINLKTAEGFSLQDGDDAFVFMKVILTDCMNTFYVEAHYTAVTESTSTNAVGIKNKTCSIIPQAFVWRKSEH